LAAAIAFLSDKLNYIDKECTTHGISLFSPMGTHIQLHFDLVEEGRANNAIDVLRSVGIMCRCMRVANIGMK
jgi:hypothetical protein